MARDEKMYYTISMLKRSWFKAQDPALIEKKLKGIPPVGRTISPKRAYECRVCRRRIGPLGRLPCPGFPVCARCELIRLGSVTELFSTPYGNSVSRATLSVITRVIEIPSGKVILERSPIIARAHTLARAHVRLVAWQEAYHLYEVTMNNARYRRGICEFVPPRRLEDVLILRAAEGWLERAPLDGLPEEKAWLIQRAFDEGAEGLIIPF